MPLVAQQVGADVIHAPHYSIPLRPGVPCVVTVHDLTFFTDPELHTAVTATFFKSAIRTAVRRATRMIVPSKATRDELVRVLGADPTRIDVAYHGVDHKLFTGRIPCSSGMSPTAWACMASRTSRSSARWSRARTCPR